jgi:small redox-active disulfide protein 2
MLIQVLGTGCTRCKTLLETVKQAVQETGVDALVEKVEDIQQIMAFEILMTPGLDINGEVKAAGRVLNVEEVKKLILSQSEGGGKHDG